MAIEVPAEKNLLVDEDVKTGASASEATMTKAAGNIHKALLEGCRSMHFMANGRYSVTAFPENAVDREWIVPFNCEIVMIRAFSKTAGVSGSTEVDIEKKQPGGAWATIFSTRPAIPFGAGDDGEIVQEFLPSVNPVFASAGCIAPVLVSTEMDQYDILRMNFVDKQQGPLVEGFGIEILVRPR